MKAARDLETPQCPKDEKWPISEWQVPVAERFVKTIKKSIKCSIMETNSFDQQLIAFLTNYRSAPHSTTAAPPYQLMFNRHVKSFLSSIESSAQNSKYDPEIDYQNRKRNNENSNMKSHRQKHEYNVGDTVICHQQRNAHTPF